MTDTTTYEKAELLDFDGYVYRYQVPVGRSMCGNGYLDCPLGGSYHWHCGNCGGISGQQGHYSKLPGQNDWQFNCPTPELSNEA